MGSDDQVVGFVLDLTERRRAEAAARAHEERVRAMSAELMLAEERERRRIATVLHDAVGQTLALAKLKIDSMRQQQQPQQADHGLPARLAEVYGLIDYAVQHTRTLTNELSPPVLYELGLEAALQWLADRCREQHGLAADFEDDGQPKPVGAGGPDRALPGHAGTAGERRQARPRRPAAGCRSGGRGMKSRSGSRTTGTASTHGGAAGGRVGERGFGLFNVRERIARLGGRVGIDSRPGQGTRVTLAVPIEAVPVEPVPLAAGSPVASWAGEC